MWSRLGRTASPWPRRRRGPRRSRRAWPLLAAARRHVALVDARVDHRVAAHAQGGARRSALSSDGSIMNCCSMFCDAKVSGPAATLPTRGTRITSLAGCAAASIWAFARSSLRRLLADVGGGPRRGGLAARRDGAQRARAASCLRGGGSPCARGARRWSLTPLVDRMPIFAPISRSVGGYPRERIECWMKSRMACWRSVSGCAGPDSGFPLRQRVQFCTSATY